MISSKSSILFMTTITAVGAIVTTDYAQNTPQDTHQDTHQSPASQPAARVSLSREMGAMDRDFNLIRKQVSDPSQNTSTLDAVVDMEQHTLAAKSVVPRSATTLPTTMANADKLVDYQSTMLNTLRQELDLEEQLRENHNDKAAAIVEALHGLETEGHAEFRPRRNRR